MVVLIIFFADALRVISAGFIEVDRRSVPGTDLQERDPGSAFLADPEPVIQQSPSDTFVSCL